MLLERVVLVFLFLVSWVTCQDCAVSDKVDCGYMGIDQNGCQDKGCCWQPTQGSNMIA